MRIIYRVDPELGKIESALDTALLDIYGELELEVMESMIISGNPLSDLYVSSSFVSDGKCTFRLRKEVVNGKTRFILKLPIESEGCIYLVHSLRAYKYVLLKNKNSYNYGY